MPHSNPLSRTYTFVAAADAGPSPRPEHWGRPHRRARNGMIPNRHRIDLSRYPRRALLEAFKDRELSCFSVTCNVEIGTLQKCLALSGHRFFITMGWILSVAANRVPQLRHRLIGGQLYEFERVDPGYTVLLDDHTFSFCDSVHREDFDAYYEDTERRVASVRASPDRSTGDRHHMIFITSVPWLSFTAFTHPFSARYASIRSSPWQNSSPKGSRWSCPSPSRSTTAWRMRGMSAASTMRCSGWLPNQFSLGRIRVSRTAVGKPELTCHTGAIGDLIDPLGAAWGMSFGRCEYRQSPR